MMETLLHWLPVAAMGVAALIALLITLRSESLYRRSFQEIQEEQQEIIRRLEAIGFRF